MSTLSQDFARHARIREMLEAMESRDPGTMPYEQRGKLVQHFTRHVLGDAQKNNRMLFDRRTGRITVAEDSYKSEITQIVRLLKSMKLSDYAMNWANVRGRELAAEMHKRFPFRKAERAWDGMDLEQRKTFLQKLAVLQADIFQKGAIAFMPSEIKLEGESGILGFVRPDLMEMETLTIPPIHVHPRLLEKGQFLTACLTAVHEQLHALFIQMAMASNAGQMPAEHPMAEDAKILFARYKYFGVAGGYIESAYRADPEEAITHSCHSAFSVNYRTPPAVR